MNLDKYEDRGKDLKKGDIVFIKFEVIEEPTAAGDCKLRYYARNGKDEYAARSTNAVFIKRPNSRLLKRIVNWLLK